MGGRPQVRERVFITATYSGEPNCDFRPDPPVSNRPVGGWDPSTWNLETDLPLDPDHHVEGCDLNRSERLWIDAWNDFVELMWDEREGRRLPGFPLWADHWVSTSKLNIPTGTPAWKADFLRKNAEFYTAHKRAIDKWTKKWNVYSDEFPASRRKLEWQAQDTPNLWSTIMHLRPSGIRAKAPTYVPALVAITQTTIVGSRERRLSPREAARLQSLPEWFDFGDQRTAATYKQLGNGVSVAAVWHVLRSHAARDEEMLKKVAPRLLRAILESSPNPDTALTHRHRKSNAAF
jgi:DNA (cytosine-5)-methyltransferase 1